MKHCCEDMEYYVCSSSKTEMLEKDENKVIYFCEVFREYGIGIRYGYAEMNSAYILISHCPWCGKALPGSKRNEWYDRLYELGIEDVDDDENIPIEFMSSLWYENENS